MGMCVTWGNLLRFIHQVGRMYRVRGRWRKAKIYFGSGGCCSGCNEHLERIERGRVRLRQCKCSGRNERVGRIRLSGVWFRWRGGSTCNERARKVGLGYIMGIRVPKAANVVEYFTKLIRRVNRLDGCSVRLIGWSGKHGCEGRDGRLRHRGWDSWLWHEGPDRQL